MKPTPTRPLWQIPLQKISPPLIKFILCDKYTLYKIQTTKNIEGLALKIVQKTYPLRSWPTGQKNSLCFPALFANIGKKH